MNQTAEHVPSFDRRSGSPPDLRCSVTSGYGQAQSPMWSLLYVVSNVSLEHSLEVPTTVDQDVVEALSAHGPHEPLRECVRPRCADRRSDDANTLGADMRSGERRRQGHLDYALSRSFWAEQRPPMPTEEDGDTLRRLVHERLPHDLRVIDAGGDPAALRTNRTP